MSKIDKAGWYYMAQDEAVGPFGDEISAQRDYVESLRRINLAMDRDSVRSYDADGRMHVKSAHISKAGVNPYFGREIPNAQALGLDPDKLYRLLRDPEELKKSVATFNNLPLLAKHMPVTSNDHHPELVIGSLGTDAAYQHPYLDNSLVFWARDPIDAIEAELQKELSSAYRYRADMTPGEYEGEAYDGVMRDIVGNHVALVRKGRAGSDVVVGDEAIHQTFAEMFPMTKRTPLSRRAVLLQGALMAHLQPKLAQDAKLDLGPILSGITAANFKDKKAGVASSLKESLKGKIAQDASLEDVIGLIDSVEKVEGEAIDEGMELDPNAGMPAGTVDADPLAKIKEFLAGKLSPEDMAQVEALCSSGAADETPEEKAAREKAEKEMKAKDAAPPMKPETVTKTAMDEAIASAVDQARKDQRAIRDAEKAVRPWVGDLVLACDSADEVYAAALKALGVKIDGVHASAYPAILQNIPLPGKRNQHSRENAIAMDSAGANKFSERFPGAARIRTL